MKLRRFLSVAPLALLTAWGASTVSSANYTVIGGDAEPIRADFNSDVGKVRVLMLVAPT